MLQILEEHVPGHTIAGPIGSADWIRSPAARRQWGDPIDRSVDVLVGRDAVVALEIPLESQADNLVLLSRLIAAGREPRQQRIEFRLSEDEMSGHTVAPMR